MPFMLGMAIFRGCRPREVMKPWARRFHATELGGRPLVVINPRQSSLTENPTVTYRDAPLPAWHAFIDAVAQRRPEALFVMVGGFQEWEHRLLGRRNVFVPRAWGLRLAHELALLKIADLFMGTSSGFATFATFTDIAYAIVNVEHSFAGPAEVHVDDRHFPFAKANQRLTWRRETTEELLVAVRRGLSRRAAGRCNEPADGGDHCQRAAPPLV